MNTEKTIPTLKDSIQGPPDFNGENGAYYIVPTQDGHTTLYSQTFDETCHSLKGAWEETCFYYVEGNKLPTRFAHTPINSTRILEIGFGQGTSLACTLESFNSHAHSHHNLEYVGFELDNQLVKYALDHHPQLSQLAWTFEGQDFIHKSDRLLLHILTGDARQRIQDLHATSENKFQVIYQDAFSPAKNPQLWNSQWFEKVTHFAETGATLTTFSCTGQVRRDLTSLGWKVTKIPGFKGKREALKATYRP